MEWHESVKEMLSLQSLIQNEQISAMEDTIALLEREVKAREKAVERAEPN